MALFTIQNEFRYQIVRQLYEGGMGIVYEAEQLGAQMFTRLQEDPEFYKELL